MLEIKGDKRTFFGISRESKETIYIYKPTFDCGWYWSFGYLGRSNLHYHLSSYKDHSYIITLQDGTIELVTERRNFNMYDCLSADYELAPAIKKNLWQFCELAKTAYALKQTAEVLGRGGSHYTTNPCCDIIKNSKEVDRINKEVLPAIFNKIQQIVEGREECLLENEQKSCMKNSEHA